jgi:hypothetical protein
VFIKETYVYFRFPNLEILESIMINTFTFVTIEVAREKYSGLPSCRHYTRLHSDMYAGVYKVYNTYNTLYDLKEMY